MDERARRELLERENEELRERVFLLEGALCATEKPLPVEWALTSSEARVFGVLVNRDLATKNAIMAALYGNVGKDDAEEKIVDVFICKLRKKLRPFGVVIHTRWGQGYELGQVDRSRFRRAA